MRCAAERVLEVTTVRKKAHAAGRTRVIFRRPVGGCQDCSVRAGCLQSKRADAHKHAEFSILSDVADRVRERLSAVVGQSPWSEPSSSAGRLAVSNPLFLPAMAHQVFAERFAQGSLWVSVMRPPSSPPRPRLVAEDVADRQRRRKTWEQNLNRYALTAGTEVHIEVAGTPALKQMIGDPLQKRLPFTGSG